MKEFFTRATSWIRKHGLVVTFALLVGTLSVLPHLLAQHALGDEYQGIPFMYEDNEDYYLARIHEITEGYYFVGSPYLFEYKDTLPVIFPIGEYFYYVLYLISGISLAHTLVLAKFLFPLILFLLVYTLVTALTKESGEKKAGMWTAVAVGLMVTLGIELTEYHTLFSRLLHGTNSEILSMWTRPVNPITGGLLLFAFLNLFWRSIERDSWKYTVGAGIVLGLSIGYIFSFALGFTLLGVFFLFASWWKNKALMRNIFWVGVIGIIIPLTYWIHVIPQLTGGSGLAERNGALLMHTPLPNKILIASFVFFGIMLLFASLKHKVNILKEPERHLALWFCIALLLDGLIVLNEQIVTGITIWPYHFVQYTVPLAMVASFVGLFFLVRPAAPRIWKMIIGMTILVVLLFSTWNSTTHTNRQEDFRQLQNFTPVFNWLNENAPKNCVVLTSNDLIEHLNGFIPAFTNCNVYLSGYANNANNTPTERIMHNFFVKLRLTGVTNKSVNEYLTNNHDVMKGYFFKDWGEIFDRNHNPRIAAMIPELADKYSVFMKKDFKTALKEYRIDYIVTKEDLNEEVKKTLPGILEMYKTGTITIYRI